MVGLRVDGDEVVQRYHGVKVALAPALDNIDIVSRLAGTRVSHTDVSVVVTVTITVTVSAVGESTTMMSRIWSGPTSTKLLMRLRLWLHLVRGGLA